MTCVHKKENRIANLGQTINQLRAGFSSADVLSDVHSYCRAYYKPSKCTSIVLRDISVLYTDRKNNSLLFNIGISFIPRRYKCHRALQMVVATILKQLL